jgi:hypothetical protein
MSLLLSDSEQRLIKINADAELRDPVGAEVSKQSRTEMIVLFCAETGQFAMQGSKHARQDPLISD